MTLDEDIKHCNEVAEEQEKAAKEWHENQVRKCELVRFAEMDYTHENECKECAKEHRQLTEWLRQLKKLKEKAEPQIVHYINDGRLEDDADAYCPNCNELLNDYWWRGYCPCCGQALEW